MKKKEQKNGILYKVYVFKVSNLVTFDYEYISTSASWMKTALFSLSLYKGMHDQYSFQLAYTWFFFMFFIGKSERNCPQNSAQAGSYSLCPGKTDGPIFPLMSFYISRIKLSNGLTTQKTPLISKTDSSTWLGGSNCQRGWMQSLRARVLPFPGAPLYSWLPASPPALLVLPSPSPGTQTRRYKKENSSSGLTIVLWWKAQLPEAWQCQH